MNSILELPTPSPEPDASPDAPPQFDHRGNGKIARLPKLIRDQVNNWLLDGLTYPDIIQRLGEHGQDLKPDHISQWKKRGYQDWLRQREWLEHLTSKSEFSTDILAAPDSSALHEAGLRLAASQMFDQLMRFSATANAADSKGQPEQFSRLVNALSRLTREALAFQKYRAATAKENTLELKRLDPNRKSSEKERDVVLHLWRDFFGHDLTQSDPNDAETAPAPPEAVEASPQIEIQKSKVKNPDVRPAENETLESKQAPIPIVPIKTPTSKIKSTDRAPVAGIESHKEAAPRPIKTPKSKIENPLAKTGSPTATGANPGEAPLAQIKIQKSEFKIPEAAPAIENQNSKFKNPAPESCLECSSPLPALRPDGGRPSKFCPICCFQLPPPGSCVERSIEKCANCRANLPRVLPTGERPLDHCHHCGSALPPPLDSAASQVEPLPRSG